MQNIGFPLNFIVSNRLSFLYYNLNNNQYFKMLERKRFIQVVSFLLFLLFAQSKSLNEESYPLRDDQIKQYVIQQSSDNTPFAVFWGFILGPALFIFSFVMTWYNEKRSAVNHRRIKKIQQLLSQKQKSTKNTIKSQATINQKLIVNESERSNKEGQKMQDKLIYVSGEVKVNGPAVDDVSKFTHPLALKINRFVEVREYRQKDNNKKKKHQKPPELEWCIFHFSEAGDKFNNPESWFMKTQDFQAQQAFVDGYKMNSNQILNISTSEKVMPTEQMAQQIAENKKALFGFIIQDNYIYFPASNGSKLSQGTLRVSYFIAKSPSYSIIAQEGLNKSLQPFRIDIFENHGHPDTLFCQNSTICGCCHAAATCFKPITQIDIVYEGKVTPDDMIKRSFKKNNAQTIVIRLLCFLCMVFGIYLFFLPIVELIGYIPLVGNFLSGAAGFFIFLGALIVCVPLFLATMALAWLFYHPKIGIALIVVAVVIAIIVLIVEETVK